MRLLTALILILSIQALAVTKVKPLKIGADGISTEASQSTDYVSSKGFAFENSDSYTLDVQSSKIYALSDGITAPVCQAPTSSTANNLALFNSTSGHLLKELAAGSNLDVLYYNSTTPAWGSLSTAGIAPKDATYVVITTTAALTNERSLAVNGTNMTLTDGGVGSGVSLNTIQNIDTTATPTFQRLLLSGSTNQNFISASGTMDAATGDETAYTMDYTVNKATSGTTRGLKMNMTDTSSPGLSYLFDFQIGGVSKLRQNEVGNLEIIRTGNSVGGTGITYSSSTGSDGVLASTEFHDVDLNLARTVTWGTPGDITTQRFVRVRQPNVALGSGADTMVSAATMAIDGPPSMGIGNMLSSYGLWVKSANVNTINVQNAIGLYAEAPTGGLQNSAAAFNGGVGINTSTPETYFDIRVPSLSSTANDVVGLDGITRYVGTYFGGTAITSQPGSFTGSMLDYGFNPASNTSNTAQASFVEMTLQGTVNTTGVVRAQAVTLSDAATAGTATSLTASLSTLQTLDAGTITTGRAIQASSNISGTGTITTFPFIDVTPTFSNVAGTTTTGHHARFVNPSKGASYTVTNWDSLLFEDNTMTVGTRKTHIRALGSTESRHVGNFIIGADATPAHKLEVKDGNLGITNTGTAGELRIYEASGSGSNYSAFKAQPQAGDVTYTLPAADGSSGQVLSTNASGTLSWVANGSGTQTVWSASKIADTSRNSTITLAADPDLDLAASWANSTQYIVTGSVYFTSANATPDLAFQWQGPAITAGSLRIRYTNIRNNSGTVADSEDETAFVNGGTAGDVIAIVAAAVYNLQFSGSFKTSGTAGTNHLQFQWAQETSDANNVTVQAGSWMRVEKVQ